jgi:hypothetical protein
VELLKQKLLILWVQNWMHQTLHTLLKGALGVAIIGTTTVTPVVVVTHKHRSQPAAKPVAVKTVPKKVATVLPKPPTPVPTPASGPVPAPVPVAPLAVPKPMPIPASQPAPGSGAKALSSTPPASQPSSSGISGSGGASSGSASVLPPATGGYTSTNWAGYVATAGSYTGVTGRWQVPNVTGNGVSTTGDSAWIGIGGVFGQDLIQTGTYETVSSGGHASNVAFYELLPDSALQITSLTVSPGDNMTAEVKEITPGNWQISISDTTTGQSYTTTLAYASSHSSAEWIEEDPSYSNGAQVPFDNFGMVSFDGGSVTGTGGIMNLLSSNSKPVTMVDTAHNPLATPSVLNATNTGFNVTRN